MTALDTARLLRGAPSLRRPPRGRFSEADLEGLPEPVQRYFRPAIAPGSSLLDAAQLDMRGQLKLGRRWLPFRARELLAPHVGFIWAARVAGVISGSDCYVDGDGTLDWKLFGLFRVVHADGPDVAHSAAGRAGGEAVWLPASLLPRFGVTWFAEDDTHPVARSHVEDVELSVRCRIDRAGHLEP